MTVKADLEAIQSKVYKTLGGKCRIKGCRKPYAGLTAHHMRYIPNDVIYKNYKPYNSTNKLRYLTDLYPLVKQNKSRFKLLCSTHHQALEKLTRYSDTTLNQLLRMRREMRK